MGVDVEVKSGPQEICLSVGGAMGIPDLVSTLRTGSHEIRD